MAVFWRFCWWLASVPLIAKHCYPPECSLPFVGLRDCKKRSDAFSGQMSYKATKPGFGFYVYFVLSCLSVYWCMSASVLLGRCHTCDFVARLWLATLTRDKVAACDFIVARCDFDAACDKQTFWEWTTIHSVFCFSALHWQSKDKSLCYKKPFQPKKDCL